MIKVGLAKIAIRETARTAEKPGKMPPGARFLPFFWPVGANFLPPHGDFAGRNVYRQGSTPRAAPADEAP